MVLAFLAWALCRNITIPWTEDDNWYGAFYSQAAHVNLEAGILTTAGVPVPLYFAPPPIPPDAFYVHHPTLLPTLVTAAFALFGESEWAARVVPVACSLLSAVLLWLLMRSAVNARAATLTTAAFATLPMELHYGDMVDFEPCLLMCMLAVLLCLRRWQVTVRHRWAVLAAIFTTFTLWMDWPGYLFILSLAAYYIFRGWKGYSAPGISQRQSLRFGLLLMGLTGMSGVIFLLQIRHVRPDAWSDLWHVATMRLSSTAATDGPTMAANAVHFTFREWGAAILDGLANDFLPLPWFLMGLGLISIWLGRYSSPGLRWCSFAMMPMAVAGVLYVTILRNQSFVHDFSMFYLIGVFAMTAGLGMEFLLVRFEQRFKSTSSRVVSIAVTAGLLVWLGASAVSRAESLRSPFSILDAEKAESPGFIPALGRFLKERFPRGTLIMCNFASNDSLDYYSQRDVVNNLMTPGDWKAFSAEARKPVGGILWLDAKGATEVAASLPHAEVQSVIFGEYRFALWRAKSE